VLIADGAALADTLLTDLLGADLPGADLPADTAGLTGADLPGAGTAFFTGAGTVFFTGADLLTADLLTADLLTADLLAEPNDNANGSDEVDEVDDLVEELGAVNAGRRRILARRPCKRFLALFDMIQNCVNYWGYALSFEYSDCALL